MQRLKNDDGDEMKVLRWKAGDASAPQNLINDINNRRFSALKLSQKRRNNDASSCVNPKSPKQVHQ